MTPKVWTYSLTKPIRHKNVVFVRMYADIKIYVFLEVYDVIKMHVFLGMFIHRKENFNIPVFLQRINVRKRVKIIPHLRERKIVKQW